MQSSADFSLDPGSSSSVFIHASPYACLGKGCTIASLTFSSRAPTALVCMSLSFAFLNFPLQDPSPVGQVFRVCVSGGTAWSRQRKLLLQHQGLINGRTGTAPLYGGSTSPQEIWDCCCTMLFSACRSFPNFSLYAFIRPGQML